MKNCSVRKIVLSSIGFLASLMLLIGLSFTVIKYDPGLKNELGAAMRQIGLSASGFDMLSFELPATLKAFMLGLFTAEDYSVDFTAFEKISGVISVLTLVTALLGIALTIVSFFCFSKKKKIKSCSKQIINCRKYIGEHFQPDKSDYDRTDQTWYEKCCTI